MVHILIERHIHEGQVSTYLEHSRKALSHASRASGFISGEAFADIKSEEHRFLLCKWSSAELWERWACSSERMETLAPIHAILTQPEKVTILDN